MQLKLLAVFVFALQRTIVVLAEVGAPAVCCQMTTNNTITISQIVSYVHQDLPQCPVKAVRFSTLSGDSVCSDPDSSWTKWAIQLVDTKKIVEDLPKPFSSDKKSRGPAASCCVKTSYVEFSVDKIASYLNQNTGLCPIRAVRFITTKGKTICSDPESRWAKFAMCMVDERKNASRAEQVCRGLPVPSTSPIPVLSVGTVGTEITEKKTDPAQQVPQTTIEPAQQARQTTIEPAQQVPQTTIEPAQQVPQTTIEPAQQIPQTTIEPAQQVPQTTIEPAQQAPQTTIEPAQQAQQTTIEPAQQAQQTTIEPAQQVPQTTIEPAQQAPWTQTTDNGLPWTLRRLIKRKKGGLRKEQMRNE